MENSTTPQSTTAWPPRQVALATLVALAIACAFWILFRFRLVFFSLFIAIVLATAIEPLIDRLARFKIPRAVSMILILLIVLALIVVGVLAVVPMISSEWATITTLFNHSYESLRTSLAASENLLLQRIAAYLPVNSPLATQPAAPQAGGATSNLAQQAVSIGSSIMRDLVLGIYVLILTGLWILEGDVATHVILMALPSARRDPAREFLGDIEGKIGAYTRGLALLTVIMGVLAAIGYGIIGLPNILFLGVFAGLMEFIPLIGPLLGAIPAFLLAASIGSSKVVLVIIVYIIIQAIESHLVVPRVMDRTVGVNPVASLLAFIAFGSIFGFLGALLAVPLAAVIQLILNRLVFNANPQDQIPPTGRDTISTLRYEAQDLVQDVRKQIRTKDAEVNAREDRIEDSMEAIAVDLDSILAQVETEDGNGKPASGGNGKQRG